MNATVKKWAPVVLMAILITTASSIPAKQIQETGIQFNDKLVHFCVYAAAGAALRHALPSPFLAMAIGSAYGAFDENYQRLIPGRDCSVWDWMADTTGAIVGAFVYASYEKFRRGRKTP